MCGLTGYWKFKPDHLGPEVIQGMAASLLHRGPDSSGIWRCEQAGFAFGHQRLAIIDLKQTGHQPMISHSGRWVLVYNGEIYNAADLKQELGLETRGTSDTEILLEACERLGVEAACKRLMGMFAFALWDRETRKLYLVRDRLGVKPLYWGFHQGVLLFGSELKALTKYPNWSPQIDQEALGLYFRTNYIGAPKTIYEGIHKLEPGHILIFDEQRRSQKICYWSFDSLPSPLGGEGLGVRLEELLKDSVKCRMIADVPLGVFLSSGVDSSTIAALMQAQSSKPIKTFSMGSEYADYDESDDAASIAKHLGTEHHSWRVTEQEAREVIPQLADIYDEPFGDASQIPTFLVSKLARGQVTVALSGDGGDELFAGYNRYLIAHRYWPVAKQIPMPIRSFIATALRQAPVGRLWERAYKFGHWLSARDEQELYARSVNQWPVSPSPFGGEGSLARRSLGIGGGEVVRNMQLADLKTYLPDDILAKVDRASMAVGLEAREPFLDHRLVELAMSLPLEQKIRGNQTKWILRKILRKYVPESIMSQKKMGFGVPIDVWLRGPLRDWAEHLLEPKRLEMSGLDVPLIRRTWEEHLLKKGNWQYPIWGVLMFETWRERWLPS